MMRSLSMLCCMVVLFPGIAIASGTEALISGTSLRCEAKSGNKSWPCRIRVTSHEPAGAIAGELTWTSLRSVHRVTGKLRGNTLTFTEVEAIRRGGAHLNVSYRMTVSAKAAIGTYLDGGDHSRGTMTIYLAGAAKPKPASMPDGVRTLLGGRPLSCEARSGSKSWPCRIRVTSHEATGAIAGELTWTSLRSVHRVTGKLHGNTLTFTEVEAIRRGSAHLNVSYQMRVSDKAATGTYLDQGDHSTGTMRITLP